MTLHEQVISGKKTWCYDGLPFARYDGLKESVAFDPRLHVPDPVSASGESGEEEVPSSAQIPSDLDSEERCRL
jgi:hypothetical protein